MVLAGSRWHVCTCGVVVVRCSRNFYDPAWLRARRIADIRVKERFERTRATAILFPFTENTRREDVARSSREFLPLEELISFGRFFRVVSPLWHDEKENTEQRQWSPNSALILASTMPSDRNKYIKRDGQFLSCCGGYSETSHFYSTFLSLSLSIYLSR